MNELVRHRDLYSRAYIRERFRDIPTALNENGVDQFGFDPEVAAKAGPYLAWIYQNYFRVQQFGVDRVPDGRCLLVSNHSGQLPYDAMMIAMSVFLERKKPRIVRAMIEKFIHDVPFVSVFFERCGQIVGTPDNCRRVLSAEEAILVFPEGARGINKLFHERYQLKQFGLGFMRLALETKTPIVPVAVVGAEEQAPAIANLKRVGKLFGLPALPITPLMLLGPLGMLPLPTKYRIYFGDPIQFEGDSNDEDAEIEQKVNRLRGEIESLLARGLREREHIFLVKPEGPIVVTGIAGNLGRLVMSRLHRHYKLIGIDRRAVKQLPEGVVHHPIDMRRKKAQDIFRTSRVQGVVHMGIMHDPRMSAKEHYTWNVIGTDNLLEYCAKYGVKKVVMLSSANNYGPMAGASAYLDEDTPLLGAFAFPEIRDLVAVDRSVSSFFWKHPEIETVILRPVHIAGARLKNAPSNFLRLKAIPTLLGFDPLVQLVHELDVVDAIATALKPGVRGIFNIVGPPAIPLQKLLTQLGRRTIPVPHPLAKPLWRAFYSLRMSSFPAPEWDFLRYELLVDGTRAKTVLGYEPKRSMRDIINLFRPISEVHFDP